MSDHIPPGTKPTVSSNTHATWLREHAAWLDSSMGYVAIPAARMRDAAEEIERLQRRETEAAILFAPLAEHDQAVREWLEETP